MESNTLAMNAVHLPVGAPGTTSHNKQDQTRSKVSDIASSLGNSLCSDGRDDDLQKYIALGCLHLDSTIDLRTHNSGRDWMELLYSDLPEDYKSKPLDDLVDVVKLLKANWIRLFLYRPYHSPERASRDIARVYLLPEDWGQRLIDRTSKSLKATLRQLLRQTDVSPETWSGNPSEATTCYFDPWANPEKISLYYLFNKLPSPAPAPENIKNRYSRRAVEDLLDSATTVNINGFGDQPVEGLKTKLYPYQARSASLMVQREAAPQLQLDPRLETRQSPNGEEFFFGARDGTFLKEAKFYDTCRGGILAESMGLGKTIICLSVILATKGHLPQIPAVYQPPPRVRDQVGSLKDMAASIISLSAIPAQNLLERSELYDDIDLSHLKDIVKQNIPFYEIPPKLPRKNRSTKIPAPRQLVMCSGTIIVVPRNLLHQWQSEIKNHMAKDSLRILIVDNVPQRNRSNATKLEGFRADFTSDLPAPTKLMEYDIILFSRTRFEREIRDGADEKGRRPVKGAPVKCACPYIGASRVVDCTCVTRVYESPLKKIHWLRIIIDEGHNYTSSTSNAVLVAKQLVAERRWIVSGTPAKNLVGVEVDLSMVERDEVPPSLLREWAIEERKDFSLDTESIRAATALGSLASHFLMVDPWTQLEWDNYIYRHEHLYQKTYSGFSTCFLRTLEALVVKTRPEDVERDIDLPPMKHRVVYLKPCWFDKMTANLFIQVLRANAITSERSDVDYLFHKNSSKARQKLIRNLRQSNFTWTGFKLEDVSSTLETTMKYLNKEDKLCSLEDASSLLESSRIISSLTSSKSWIALGKAHEVGLAIEHWPQDSEGSFSLSYTEKPTMIGITQLLSGQLHVDSHILTEAPARDLHLVGQAEKAKIERIQETETKIKKREQANSDNQLKKAGVPSSCVAVQPLTSRRASTMATVTSPSKSNVPAQDHKSVVSEEPVEEKAEHLDSLVKTRKRKLTQADEMAELPEDSPLRDTKIVGTTSAKLSYLIGKVLKHQAEEKIIIFYDGDNTAFYIAQALEMLYINHRIYARNLDNAKRSEYVKLFSEHPDVRVLLIDVACGALGLNLNAASVVLIVNPINRPGLEAQVVKRAHRIGCFREVLVETLVLEGTIEEAIFKHAKNMSHQQHLEVKELEDDAGIVDIIQNAQVLPIDPEESQGIARFAPLGVPQQVFGRPNRQKYHRFGFVETTDNPKKRAKTVASDSVDGKKSEVGNQVSTPSGAASGPLANGSAVVAWSTGALNSSLFGNGDMFG